jgi:hypothetical protein
MTAPDMESALLDWASDNGLKHEVMIKVSLADDCLTGPMIVG